MNPMQAWLAQDKLFPLLPGTTQEQIGGIVASLVIGPLLTLSAGFMS